jgi:glucosamine kinase
MILIADSGSTKTEWSLVDQEKTIKSLITSGINPFYQDETNIVHALQTELVPHIKVFPEHIYFYGAGCADHEKISVVKNALHQIFPSAHLFAGSDLLGVARSLCQNNPGIACILGTGSNSCYYDGKEIIDHISPLGYILGDEGSGAVMGKKLISDILKQQLPQSICKQFFDTCQVHPADILDAVYKKPFPNRYLAQYTKFIHQNIHLPEMEELVITSFQEFISRNILQYRQASSYEIHFSGSIAYYFKPQLSISLNTFQLKEGRITMAPTPDLINYHKKTHNQK